ncbi:unnamed protein product [Peronospora belbahrii]|uniref:Uncharacterized protein n=1 Tax=Peronospora belbahrii TaxID=622444 RepID=A0ABN8CZY6_9STRA|nr:unnamed protein product [Peronospora belbahrii]
MECYETRTLTGASSATAELVFAEAGSAEKDVNRNEHKYDGYVKAKVDSCSCKDEAHERLIGKAARMHVRRGVVATPSSHLLPCDLLKHHYTIRVTFVGEHA